MAITIDSTVGGAAANSYVTLAEWTTYLEGRLNVTAFTGAASDDIRNRALAEATRELSAISWAGVRTDDTQALAWPRDLVRNPDDPNYDFYDDGVIPERVKRATYELALAFLKSGTVDIVSLDTTINVRRTSIAGAIETEYYDPGHRITGLARYPAVMREIRPLLAASSKMTVDVTRS
jgi:hypothetical protein